MKVLIITTHPDDETLGAGGTILKHRNKGDEIHWFIGTAAFAAQYSQEHIEKQRSCVNKMSEMYGMTSVSWPGLPTTCLDQIPLNEIIVSLKDVIDKVQPHCIYTVGNHDVHTDHSIIFSALLTTIKSYNHSGYLQRIMTYEVISSTDVYPLSRAALFVPNVYSDITSFIDIKLEIMSVVEDELQPSPLPRSMESIRALARYRGSIIGVEYAEAFNLIFETF